MVNFVAIIGISFVVIGLGGGGGYLLWLKTRPKKLTWRARVYQVGEGRLPVKRDKQGKKLSEVKLSELRPYVLDVLERVEKDHGVTIHRLVRLNRTTSAVTGDCVERWGDTNFVDVLLSEDAATVMKKGFDGKTGKAVFNPIPRERLNMITENILVKQARLQKEKDILAAITPWVVVGVSMMALVFIAYLHSNAIIKTSELQDKSNRYFADKFEQSAAQMNSILAQISGDVPKVQSDTVSETPPSIE